MQPIVNIDDIELALGTENASGQHNILMNLLNSKINIKFYFLDLPDVSLVTNKLRNVTILKEESECSSKLNVRSDLSLSTVTQNRTWMGLNPHDTRPSVILATEGRKGTPSSGYTTIDSTHLS